MGVGDVRVALVGGGSVAAAEVAVAVGGDLSFGEESPPPPRNLPIGMSDALRRSIFTGEMSAGRVGTFVGD